LSSWAWGYSLCNSVLASIRSSSKAIRKGLEKGKTRETLDWPIYMRIGLVIVQGGRYKLFGYHTDCILKLWDSPNDTHSETEILGPAFATRSLASYFFAFRSVMTALALFRFICRLGGCIKAIPGVLLPWSRDPEAWARWVAAEDMTDNASLPVGPWPWGFAPGFSPESWQVKRFVSCGTAHKTSTGTEFCDPDNVHCEFSRQSLEY